MKAFFFILLINAGIVIGIFLPYIHGDYDNFSVGLSHIFQFAAFASLLLVPIGLIWSIMDFVKRGKNKTPLYTIYLKRMAWVVTGFIFLAAALGSFVSHNRFAAIIILGVGAFLMIQYLGKGMKVKSPDPVRLSSVPFYFILIPLAVLCIRMIFLESVKIKSTDFVIKQSEALIEDIESYKKSNGHYPLSLQSTIEDYKTCVSGIERFHYEPNGQAYNLYFEQFSDIIGTQEIVMYNRLDEHEMTVHNQDLLRITPENISRGYHVVKDLPQQHWKVFYFD